MRRFNTAHSFIDMLFNTLMGFFILLLLSIILVNPVSKDKDVELKIQFMITAEWPDGSRDDVDLIVGSPDGKVVFYGRPNTPGVSLDRDDRGHINDVVTLADGTKIVVEENWENINIRKNIPGEFLVNVRMFSKREAGSTPVKIKIIKVNPHQLVYMGNIILKSHRQEETAIRFTIDAGGNVISTSKVPITAQEFLQINGAQERR